MKVWRFALVPKDEHTHYEESDDVEADVVSQAQQGQLCEVEVPIGARILPTVKMSSKGLTMYAVVDPEAELETRSFFVCSNGVDLPEGAMVEGWRGTYKRAGSLTAHVFEVMPVAA